MKKIGITGNIASGKSVVEKIIEHAGFKVIDADKICHLALENDEGIIKKVKMLFGGEDILSAGKIDRTKVAKIVFLNEVKKKKLEEILHPFVMEKIEEFFLNNEKEPFVFASAALLFEAQMNKMFDKIILVTANDDARILRLMERNSLSKDAALVRINAQKPQEDKIKLADFVIENNSNIDELKLEVEKILKLLH